MKNNLILLIIIAVIFSSCSGENSSKVVEKTPKFLDDCDILTESIVENVLGFQVAKAPFGCSYELADSNGQAKSKPKASDLVLIFSHEPKGLEFVKQYLEENLKASFTEVTDFADTAFYGSDTFMWTHNGSTYSITTGFSFTSDKKTQLDLLIQLALAVNQQLDI